MKALIDADVLVYKCGFAAQKNMHHFFAGGSDAASYLCSFDNAKEANAFQQDNPDTHKEIEVVAEPVQNALHNVKLAIERVMDITRADDYVLCISGGGNFRELVDSTAVYKGNRIDAPKPVHTQAIKDYMTTRHPHVLAYDIEADDWMGIHQTEDTIICSIDKDLLMIEGQHYNLDSTEVVYQDPFSCRYTFVKQLIEGDRVDNIPGLKGYGGKKAERLLEETDPGQWWDMIHALYLGQFNDPWVVYEQAYLLWILRSYEQIERPIDFRAYTSPETYT